MRPRPHALRTSCAVLTLSTLAACGGGGGTAPTSPSAPPSSPFTLDTWSVDVDRHAVTVRFTTSEAAEPWIERFDGATLLERHVSPGGRTTHVFEIGGLEAGSDHRLVVHARSADGEVVSSDPVDVRTLDAGAIRSDGFSDANVDLGAWRLVDPFGVGRVALFDNGVERGLELGVPAGQAHLPWDEGNDALRLLQEIDNTNVDVRVRFLNELGVDGTGNGLLFEDGPERWLRFDFAYTQDAVQVFAGAIVNGVVVENQMSPIQAAPWPAGSPLEMRVTRTGDLWEQFWSTDGTNWMPGGSFTLPLTLRRFGLQAINTGGDPGAHTTRVDFVEASLSPLVDDDMAPRADERAPWPYHLEVTALDDRTAVVRWRTDEPTLATLRWGLDETLVGGSHETVQLSREGTHVIRGLAAGTPHKMRLEVRDEGGLETWRDDVPLEPASAAAGLAPEIRLWTAQELSVGSWLLESGVRGNANQDLTVLGRLEDLDEARVAQTCTLQYRLDDGPWGTLDLGDDPTRNTHPPRLAHEGDFNLEIPVDDLLAAPTEWGRHVRTLELLAQDDDGHVRFATVRIEHVPGVTWPMGTTDFGAHLLAGETAVDAVQVIDGRWRLEDHATLGPVLRTEPDQLGYDRLAAIGEAHGPDAWGNYEVRTHATVLGLSPLSDAHAVGFGLRWIGHNDGFASSQLDHDVFPLGGLFVYRWWDDGSERWQFWRNENRQVTNLYGVAPVEIGVTYDYRMRVETQPAGGTRYRLRRWERGTAEPTTWDLDETTPVQDDPQQGSFLMVAHHVDAAFGSVTVTSLD